MRPKIIITGISSFIGHHLAQRFSKDFEVYGTLGKELSTYAGDYRERLDPLISKINTLELDITNQSECLRIIRLIRPKFWIHHAGFVKNYGSFDYDMEAATKINVQPLQYIIPHLKENGCSGMLVSGTSMEYSDSDICHDEDEICHPRTPYGQSKLQESLEAVRLGKVHDLPIRVIRIFNPFGVYEGKTRLLPSLVKSIINNQSFELTSCTQIRNFIHVETLSEIYHHLAVDILKNNGQEIFNGAISQGIQLREFLVLLCHALNCDPRLLLFDRKGMRGSEHPVCDAKISKLASSGFMPRTNIQQEIVSYGTQVKEWLGK